MPETSPPADGKPLAALLRPELEDLRAYVPHDGAGVSVKLDANEAPPSLSPAVREAVARAVSSVPLERYPDPRALRLKEAIARRTGSRPEELLIGTGSDEVIALLTTALAQPRRRNAQAVVLMPTPTFVMYRVTARGHGWKPVEVPLDSAWDLDVSMMSRAIGMMAPNVVFVASPNNPTGNRMSGERLEALARQAGEAFFVIDEAYVDYARPAPSRPSKTTYPNVATLRTLSKVGLAALRIGWLEADPAIVSEIDKVRQPFNLSALAQAAAAAVLEDAWEALTADVEAVVRARGELARAIAALDGYVVTPSDANFLWVKTPGPAGPIYDHLLGEGILVRSFHATGGRLGSQLRITVGTDEDHGRLLESLARAPR